MCTIWAARPAVLVTKFTDFIFKKSDLIFVFISCCKIGLYGVKKTFNLFFVPLYCQKTEWREFIPLWLCAFGTA